MEYKPIIDKAREFIDFFNETLGKLSNNSIVRASLEFDEALTRTTRDRLVYASDYGFFLYTPIGTIVLPGYWILSPNYVDRLNGMLVEKFGMIKVYNNHKPLYCVPHDPNQPNLPPLDANNAADEEYRMHEIFRTSNYDTHIQYFKLRMGGYPPAPSDEGRKEIQIEYDNWQEEVSKVDNTIPFSVSTRMELRSELGFDHYTMTNYYH